MRPFIPRLVAFAMFATACQDSGAPTAPVPAPPLSERIGQGVGVSVMTRNLYIGFDADAAIAALATGDPTIFGPVLLASVTTLQNTDFHVRAQTIVDEIARTRPHAVGLQEVYRIHADLSALNLPITIDLDYLAILQAALAERHLPYVVAGSVVDSDLQPLPGIELVDREVLLVDASRARVGAGVVARTFQANIGVIAPGIDKKAGYIVAPITIGDLGVTLVTTHLESDLGPGSYPQLSQLRAAQAAEIIGVIGTAPRVVVLGDLNDVEGSLMYRALAQAGLVDTWRRLRPNDPGLTSDCFVPDLSNAEPRCNKRIDFILERGLDRAPRPLIGSEQRVGILPFERKPGPAGLIWPSDHAGVVGELVVVRGEGTS